MKITFGTAAPAIAALGLGLGLGLAGPAGASTAQSAPHAAQVDSAAVPSKPVVLNCLNKPEVRPGTLVLTCADDGTGLQGMHWTSWTTPLASGYGTFYENDCIPNCAEGHIHYYPVLVMLWGSRAVKGHPGDSSYTETTLVFPGARPPVYVTENGKVVATYPVTQTLPA
jgi:hypothetical protein